MGRVDLSADLGELEGKAGRRHDEALMAFLSTAHLACGGHAGDRVSMEAGIEAALDHGVALGAHPSYVDREGFGRRRHGAPSHEVIERVLDQLATLDELAGRAGVTVRSVKPHGALYHDLSRDADLADALFDELRARHGVVVLAAGSPAAARATLLGLVVVEEGFCDRRYGADGELISRDEPDALLDDPVLAAAQAVALATEGLGAPRRSVGSLCLHSDHHRSLEIARATRDALDAAGIDVLAP